MDRADREGRAGTVRHFPARLAAAEFGVSQSIRDYESWGIPLGPAPAFPGPVHIRPVS